MTETTNPPPPDRMKELPKKEPKFYRHKRIIHPLLISIAALFILKLHPFAAFLIYVLSGLIWDWVVFNYNGRKDSALLPKFCFEEIGITDQQLDDLNNFMVNVRRWAFTISATISAAAFIFLSSTACAMMFMLTYIAVTLSSMIIATKSGKIISLYRFNGNIKSFEPAYPGSIPLQSDSTIVCQRYQTHSTDSINSGNDESGLTIVGHFDPFDPNSTAAYSPGGLLDPNRFHCFHGEIMNIPSTQTLEDYGNH